MFIPLQAQFMASCQRMNALEYITEDDVLISSFFPKELSGPIYPLIEYRIKLCAKNDTTIQAGGFLNMETCCIMDKKKDKLCMYLKPYEYPPLTFVSGGFIHPRFVGRLNVSVINHASQDVKIPSGSIVADVLCQPYSL